MELEITKLNELKDAAQTILEHHSESRVFAIYGEMGAGKTTIIKEFCQLLQSPNLVSSPTFTIINEYEDCFKNPIFHFDLYRLKNSIEASNIGIEDYLYSGHYCFIEWPDIIESVLPEGTIIVNIKVDDSTKKRIIEF